MPSYRRARTSTRTRRLVGSLATVGAASLVLASCALPPLEDMALSIGTLLPLSASTVDEEGNVVEGELVAGTGFAAEAGVALAVEDINAAGLGMTVTVEYQDSGDAQAGLYADATQALIDAEVSVVIGPGSSGIGSAIIEDTSEAGILLLSPSDASNDSDGWDSANLYWSTAAPETAQADALAELLRAEGRETGVVIVVQQTEATDLALAFGRAFDEDGGRALDPVVFENDSTNLNTPLDAALTYKGDALVIVANEQAGRMAQIAIIAGYPIEQILLSGRSLSHFRAEGRDGDLEGLRGIGPNPTVSDEFKARLDAAYTALHATAEEGEEPPALTLEDYTHAAEAYDGVVVSALAAMQARSTEGARIRDALPSVTGGTVQEETQVCTSFAECAQLLRDNVPIDYDGLSGGLAFNSAGQPTEANLALFQYDERGRVKFVSVIGEQPVVEGEEPTDSEAETSTDEG